MQTKDLITAFRNQPMLARYAGSRPSLSPETVWRTCLLGRDMAAFLGEFGPPEYDFSAKAALAALASPYLAALATVTTDDEQKIVDHIVSTCAPSSDWPAVRDRILDLPDLSVSVRAGLWIVDGVDAPRVWILRVADAHITATGSQNIDGAVNVAMAIRANTEWTSVVTAITAALVGT